MESEDYISSSICMLDDSEDDLLVFKRALKRLDVSNPLLHFNKAEQALSYLKERKAQSGQIGVILLDINLPGRDGVSFLKSLRELEGFALTPVVMFTTSNSPEDIKRSYAAGASAFVTKPISTGKFIDAVGTILDFWLHVAKLPSRCFEVSFEVSFEARQ